MKKNLRKLLVVVLVVAMVLSIGAISASAAFTDTKDTKYGEAIGVLSGLKVIDGTTSTTYEPTGALTREAAAKIIAYMMLGPVNADLIKNATGQKFSDVEMGRWSAGFIEYCANQGIVGGVGDNKFNPSGELTTAAFTKMLLCALGYKADVEGLSGNNSWANNTAALAVVAGVYDSGIQISATAVCTREQAAQLALKALKANLVQYTGGSSITIGGTTITTGAARSNVTYTVPGLTAVKYNGIDDGVVQFCEQHFVNLRTQSAFQGGRNGFFWLNAATYISGFISNDVVLATKTGGTALATLQDPASSRYVGYQADSTVATYVNDYLLTATDPNTGATADAVHAVGDIVLAGSLITGTLYRITTAIAIGDAFNSGVGGNCTNLLTVAADSDLTHNTAGVVVNFVDTDYNGKYNVISFVQKSVAQLAAAPTTTTSGTLSYVTIAGPITAIDSRFVTYPDGLAQYDVVTYYNSAGTHWYVDKATKVSGTINTYTGINVSIDSTAYACAGLSGMPASYDTLTELQGLIGVPGFSFYVDAYNNIVYTVAPSGAATLTNSFLVTAVDFTASFGVTTYQAMVLAPDGTVSTINVKKTADSGGTLALVLDTGAPGDAIVLPGAMADGKLAAGLFYTFAKNSDGSYNLTAAANQSINATDLTIAGLGTAIDAGDTSFTIANSHPNFLVPVTAAAANWTTPTAGAADAVLGTSSTVFLIFNPVTYTYTVYTGVTNVPNYGAGGTIYVLKDSTNTYATVVMATGGTSTVVGASDKIYVTSGATTTLDAYLTPLYTYTAVVNGVAGQSVTSYTAMDAGKLYTSNNKANGVYISTAEATTIKTAALADVTYNAGTMGVTGGSYLLSDTCVIYVYDISARTITTMTPDAAAAYTYAAGTDFLYAQAVSSTNPALAFVYITVA